jgi:hypothetical protein
MNTSKENMMARLFTKIAAALFLTVLCVTLSLGMTPVKHASAHSNASAASCFGETCNGKYPEAYGCTSYVSAINTHVFGDGYVRLMYSSRCNVFYVQAAFFKGFGYLYTQLERVKPLVNYFDSRYWYTMNSRMIGWNGGQYFGYECIGEYECTYLYYNF